MEKKKSLRHDVNNHLAVIYGYVQLIEKKSESMPEINKWVGVIKKECEKLQALVEKKSD